MENLFYPEMTRFYFRTFDILDSVPVTAVRGNFISPSDLYMAVESNAFRLVCVHSHTGQSE